MFGQLKASCLSRLFTRTATNGAEPWIFLGLDYLTGKPIRIPMSRYLETHLSLIGATGFGKTLLAQGLLAQSLHAGHAVFVIDAKGDARLDDNGKDYLASVLMRQCELDGYPFVGIDLHSHLAQVNPLLCIKTVSELEALLFRTFELDRSPNDQYGDHFRNAGRTAARAVAAVAMGQMPCSIADMAHSCDDILKHYKLTDERYKGFGDKLKELGSLAAFCTRGTGPDAVKLAAPLQTGGVVFIKGSTLNNNIQNAQRMLLMRLMQLCLARPNGRRHCVIFADDFRYTVGEQARAVMDSVRSADTNMITAFTNLSDLGVDEDAVLANSDLKIMFKSTSPKMSRYMSDFSGKVPRRERYLDLVRNMAGRELQATRHREREVMGPFLETSVAENLPRNVYGIYGLRAPIPLAYTCPVEDVPLRKMPITRGAKPASETLRLEPTPLIIPSSPAPATFKFVKK
jgi:Type IV secretion-system coupling protein DNA-binding domain